MFKSNLLPIAGSALSMGAATETLRLLSHCKIPVLVYKETRSILAAGEQLIKQ